MFKQAIGNTPESALIRYELKALHTALPGIVLQVLSSLLQQTGFTFQRGTALPSTVPSEVSVYVLNQQATGQGDIFYVSLQSSASRGSQWEWYQLIKAR